MPTAPLMIPFQPNSTNRFYFRYGQNPFTEYRGLVWGGSNVAEPTEVDIQRAGMGLLYLPAYSPDFNPIEQVFAKVKELLRKAAARSFDAICDALKTILERFSPAECSKYIRHAGYHATKT